MMVNLVLTAASLCFLRMPFGRPTGIERVQARARRRSDRSEAGANRRGRRGGSALVVAQGAAVTSWRCSQSLQFAIALRLIPIVVVPSVGWPDEIFQVLERLHRHCSVFPESAGSEFNG